MQGIADNLTVLRKAIKFRLYPNREQTVMFAKTFGCCRKVYNELLSKKIEAYKATGKNIRPTPAHLKDKFPYLKEVDSLALANKQLDLERAFKNFYDKSRKKRCGFPKFKSAKHSRKSYTTNNQQGTVAIYERAIKLPKVGRVRAVIHRQPLPDWKLKSATISQDSDGKYYASVLFEYQAEIKKVTPDLNKTIGLDYASDGLYVDDQGHKGAEHKYGQESQRRLARAQRKLSRKRGNRKGEEKSKNYLKQRTRVNKLYCHVAHQRLDNLHKLSTERANRYDIVCIEDLNMRAMSNRGFGNGRATMDNANGKFISMLDYKLNERGKHLIRVDKWFSSSQLCHRCGRKHPEMKIQKQRKRNDTMRCECGLVMDRDQNAAINIKREGLRIFTSAQ